MKLSSPKIDRRKYSDLLRQAQSLLPFYTPEWRTGQALDPGQALLNIFLHIQEQVISRLNRVPDKNFVAFLDMMSIKLLPAQSAKAAVTFTLTKGTNQDIRVPKGTLLSGQAADGSGEVIFQTEKDLLVTPAILEQVFSFDALNDQIFGHTQDLADGNQTALFSGEDKQERSLYIGHEDLFNQEKPTKIELDFLLAETASDRSDLEVVWEYNDGSRWVTITRFSRDRETGQFDENDETELFTKSGKMVLIKKYTGEISKAEVNSIKTRWLRCRLAKTLPGSASIRLPEVNTVRISVNPAEPFSPDLAFNNDAPLNLEEISVQMLAIEDVVPGFYKIEFTGNPPSQGDTVIELDYAPGGLEVGDSLLLDNREDEPETREIVTIAMQDITLNEPLKFDYQTSSKVELLTGKRLPKKGEKDIYLRVEAGELFGGDFLKLDSRFDSVEIREIEAIDGDKITLREPLQFDYGSTATVMLFTALRPSTPSTPNQPVRVKSLEGSEVDVNSKVTLFHRGQKESADLTAISDDKTTLTLTREISDPGLFYIEGDTLKITSKIKPFGEFPQIFDTFYIASDEAFSKKGAKITIELESELRQPGPDDPTVPAIDELRPILSWEYWNGNSWRGLRVVDTTNRFLTEGTGRVSFTCPKDIAAIEINGEEKYWIRARIIDGNYGTPILIDGETFFGVKTVEGFVYFPIISHFKIDYESVQQQPQVCLTLNNLNLEDHTKDCIDENRKFAPFQILPEPFPGLFLGFKKKLVSGPVRILFELTEQFLTSDQRLKMLWFYWNGSRWVQVNVEDETEHLTKIGILEFIGSKDFESRKLFGNELFWLKGSVVEGSHPEPVRIGSIHPNTTYALQADVANNEIVGSSNGTANQEFALQHPLVIDQEVWVDEPVLTEEERENISRERGEGAVKETKNEAGEIVQNLVRWVEVDDLDDSDASSRHYTVNKREGKIKFGDGVQGMVPQAGTDNIIASYRFGGGKKGNVPVSSISGLKSAVPFVKGVANYLSADGGSETETLENVLVRGPLRLKNRDRAVAPEDFEALAKSISRKVVRAKCLPNIDESRDTTPGWVTVMIVPDSEGDKPEPSKLLRNVIEDGLRKASSNTVSVPDHIHVTGPDYLEALVEATVVPSSLEAAAAVEQRVRDELNKYFHPLTGGADGAGWDFGGRICFSEIYALIEGVQDVDFAENISLHINGSVQTGDVQLNQYTLPFSGNHKINITMAPSGDSVPSGKTPKTDWAEIEDFESCGS